jgi:hypothetical protein
MGADWQKRRTPATVPVVSRFEFPVLVETSHSDAKSSTAVCAHPGQNDLSAVFPKAALTSTGADSSRYHARVIVTLSPLASGIGGPFRSTG